MYIKIGNTVYTDILSLSFIPETDILSTSLPVNEFIADIKTTDEISYGASIALYDDRDTLWADYWVTYAEYVKVDVIRVRGQSKIMLLEQYEMSPVYYSAEPLSSVLSAIFQSLGSNAYTLDTSFSGETITGFCPQQTARERLLWVCFVINAYIKTYFTDKIEILPVDDNEILVPIDKTYYKPTVKYNEYVTGVQCTYYGLTPGQPTSTDKWVWDGTDYYIVVPYTASIYDTDVPATAGQNIKVIKDVTLVNVDNVDQILSHLTKYYFNRAEVDIDAIDNGDYMPGQRLLVYSDEHEMMSGYAKRCKFTFGLQAQASIHLVAAIKRDAFRLIIYYTWNGTGVENRQFDFPAGFAYEVTNPFLDVVRLNHRYIFRPVYETATGVMQEGIINENYQPVEVALDLDRSNQDLTIISVDKVTERESGNHVIGVIS